MRVETITNYYDKHGKLAHTQNDVRDLPGGGLLSLPQAAKLMNLSRQTVWAYCQKGKIPHVHENGHYHIRVSDALSFVRPRPGRIVRKALEQAA
jgi:hypothetical protein